ncbi:MAG: DNA-directed RNA polymerase subunit alpha [Candidatus Scalindua sp.]|nr:DNA-directed RNA polymerase subunit alpha [Candidatus Scalindua sp.]
MRIRWRDFELPTKVIVDKETYTDTYGKFFVEPFERGFGSTIGNSLRRVLLSSIEGSAITSVRFEGIKHEFGIIPGVVEDVTDIILNIKNVFVKLHSDNPRMIRIEATKKGEVQAKDIITDEAVEIINGDLHIATLNDQTRFVVEMEVRNGRGYKTAEEVAVSNREIDVIPIDAVFSPIRRTKVYTEETRVGRKTNYDRLIIEIWTNGSILPEMALVESTKILRKHLNPFIHYFELGRELPQAGEKLLEITEAPEEVEISDEGVDQKLSIPVTELDLSVRAANCLEMANIKTIGEIVGKREDELLELKNFGKTTLNEIKKKLTQIGLSFKMMEEANQVGKEMSYET